MTLFTTMKGRQVLLPTIEVESWWAEKRCPPYLTTGAIMIQENWDDSVQTDVINLLRQLIPKGVWLHDKQDGNGDSHLKAGLVGPSETIPVINGELGLSTWQNIFFCEFDGPRATRKIVCTIIAG